MTGLLGPNGQPISSGTYGSKSSNFRKDAPPVLGEAFGNWAGRDMEYLNLPGGGVVQFDLSRLTLADFRQMTNHYQVNSSLSVLMFMLHQLDWHIECDNKRIAAHVEQNMSDIWTRLVRAMSQAFWAGYSPSILQWENDAQGRTVQLAKIKDLAPEEASVNWKLIDGTIPPGSPVGAVPPKIRVYDGIKQFGVASPIPTENSFWYPLLMQQGDYRGRKLLKSAFQPWFFSTLIHLFSNRYFERFGEPVPIGRAPFDTTVDVNNTQVPGNQYMAGVIQSIRSRSVAVLPSDRALDGTGSPTNNYEYDIEYLESQMRGADFERYMTRLDEEISLALFTPILLMRTADVGSYNLGVSHLQMYLWQLNAIAGDWAEYINKYILAPMANYNFGSNSKRPKIVFHKMGKTQSETTRSVLSALVSGGKVKVDLIELGQATGLTLTEIKELTTQTPVVDPNAPVDPNADPNADPSATQTDTRTTRDRTGQNPATVADKVTARIASQALNAFKRGTFGSSWTPDFGYTSQVPQERLATLERWNNDLLNPDLFSTADEYISVFAAGVKDILVDA